jgi:hypothetical protein
MTVSESFADRRRRIRACWAWTNGRACLIAALLGWPGTR